MTDLTYTLDQIEDACENATDGPWRWSNTNRNAVHLYGARTRVVMGFDRLGMQGAQPTFRGSDGLLYKSATENINDFADARFIAMARTALPELAAEVKRLREALDVAPVVLRLAEMSDQVGAWKARAEKAEAALARVQALTGWIQVGRDTNGVDRLVPASEILAALKETP